MNIRKLIPDCKLWNKMTLLKVVLIGLCYFLWTTEFAKTNQRSTSSVQEWFQRHGLTCSYCKKNYFKKVLVKSTAKERVSVKPRVIIVAIEPRVKRCVIDKRFLSFTLDTLELMRGLKCFPLADKKINILVRNLYPAYFRVGGTPQDFLYFIEHDSVRREENLASEGHPFNCTPKFHNWERMKRFEATDRQFLSILNFTQRNNLDFIFGLNAKTRDKLGKWNPTNVRSIIERVAEYKNVHWTLGNEPNRFNKYGTHAEVETSQLSEDFRYLRRILPAYQKLLGPDISRPNRRSLQYLNKFLKQISSGGVDAVTYHLYDMHQSQATLDSFLNPVYLYKLREEMQWISNLTNSKHDVWISETGSASGGGASGLSDRFVSGFLYLSKIGLVTEECQKVFIRQSFYGGYYGMLDPINHDPLPDYWSSLLFKQLIGNRVLSLRTVQREADQRFRAHAYCSKTKPSDVVVMFINMNRMSDLSFLVSGFSEHSVKLYILTNQMDLQSPDVYLNGNLLKLTSNLSIPNIIPLSGKQPVQIPRLSYGFVVINDVNFKECL